MNSGTPAWAPTWPSAPSGGRGADREGIRSIFKDGAEIADQYKDEFANIAAPYTKGLQPFQLDGLNLSSSIASDDAITRQSAALGHRGIFSGISANSARALETLAKTLHHATPRLTFFPSGRYVLGLDARKNPIHETLAGNSLVTGSIWGGPYEAFAPWAGLAVPRTERLLGPHRISTLALDLSSNLALTMDYIEALNILGDDRIRWRLASPAEISIHTRARHRREQIRGDDPEFWNELWMQPNGVANLQLGAPVADLPTPMSFDRLLQNSHADKATVSAAVSSGRPILAWRLLPDEAFLRTEQDLVYYTASREGHGGGYVTLQSIYDARHPGGYEGSPHFTPSPDKIVTFSLAATIASPQAIAPYRLDTFDGPA